MWCQVEGQGSFAIFIMSLCLGKGKQDVLVLLNTHYIYIYIGHW